MATRTIEGDDANFDRDHGGLHEIMQGQSDMNTPSRTLIKNLSDSLDSPKQPKLYKESTAKLYAQENLEKSLKSARRH